MCLVTKRKKTKYYVLYNYVFWILGAEKDDELEKEKRKKKTETGVNVCYLTYLIWQVSTIFKF